MTPAAVHSESVKYKFTDPEIVALARKQARHMEELSEAESSFDYVKADHKSKVTKIEGDISDCTRRVTSGYEMREVRCMALKFRPDKDSALVIRTDTGRVLRKRRLEDHEKQLKLSTTDNPYTFECDFFEDTDSDVAEMVADHVPLTAQEAEALRESGITLKPLRPLIDAPAAAEDRKTQKDAKQPSR